MKAEARLEEIIKLKALKDENMWCLNDYGVEELALVISKEFVWKKSLPSEKEILKIINRIRAVTSVPHTVAKAIKSLMDKGGGE